LKSSIKPGRHKKKRLRVLVVDDSSAVRQVLSRLLSPLPQFELIGEAEDGCQALGAIAELQPDLVILDIRMPKVSGLEVLQKLQQQHSTCRVVVFSQVGDEIYRQKCLQLGAEDFFDKVTGFDQFQQKLLTMEQR